MKQVLLHLILQMRNWPPERWNDRLKVTQNGDWQKDSISLLQVHSPFHAAPWFVDFLGYFSLGSYNSPKEDEIKQV